MEWVPAHGMGHGLNATWNGSPWFSGELGFPRQQWATGAVWFRKEAPSRESTEEWHDYCVEIFLDSLLFPMIKKKCYSWLGHFLSLAFSMFYYLSLKLFWLILPLAKCIMLLFSRLWLLAGNGICEEVLGFWSRLLVCSATGLVSSLLLW